MIGLVFTIGNIFLSQQNIGVDLNNISLGIHPPLFFLQESLDLLEHYLSFEFLEDYVPFTILNYFGKNSLILMCTQKTVLYYFCNCRMEDHIRMPGIMAWRYYIDCLGAMILVMIIEYSIITFI